jgi:hypothetical protein
VKHGRAGYQQRGCRCDICRTAATDYQREFRQTHPETYENELAAARATSRALYRLAQQHPDQYEAIYNEERAAEGLPPVGTSPLGRKPHKSYPPNRTGSR